MSTNALITDLVDALRVLASMADAKHINLKQDHYSGIIGSLMVCERSCTELLNASS
jgi:hypothetical protein